MKTDFKKIPGYQKYTINSDGIVKNAANEKVINLKTGTKKYQLFNDKGIRKLMSADELKALIKEEKPKATAAVKEPAKENDKPKKTGKPKKDPEVKREITQEHRDILAMKIKSHEKAFRLYNAKLPVSQIAELMERPKPATARDIWYYTSGEKKLSE